MKDLTRVVELDEDLQLVNEYLRSELSWRARKGLETLRELLEGAYDLAVKKAYNDVN